MSTVPANAILTLLAMVSAVQVSKTRGTDSICKHKFRKRNQYSSDLDIQMPWQDPPEREGLGGLGLSRLNEYP